MSRILNLLRHNSTQSKSNVVKNSKRQSNEVSVIQPSCCIEGKIEALGTVEVCGRVLGDICVEEVILREGSHVCGTIRAKICRVCGEVKGHIIADRIIVEQHGHVDGDIDYASLSIEPGGVVSGACRHYKQEAALEVALKGEQMKEGATVINVRNRQEKVKCPA